MPGSIGSTRSLVLGLVLSVALHAGVGGVLARYGTLGFASRSGAHPPPPVPPARPPEPLLTLGIEQSTAVTDTWLGFSDPTEHSGPKASVEQPDISQEPGPSMASDRARSADPVPPQPESRAPAATTSVVAENPPAKNVEPSPSEVEPQETAVASDLEPSDQKTPAKPDLPEPPPVPPAPFPREEARPKPAPQPANPPTNSGKSAEESERESTAAALKEAVEARPGHPVAAKGLEITTVRPRWSITTQIVASPKNPVVKVTFGRSGRVIRAEFVRGQNTGWEQVDGPLLDAIYRWRAKGEALGKLPPSPPGAGLPIIFRITLRNEALP